MPQQGCDRSAPAEQQKNGLDEALMPFLRPMGKRMVRGAWEVDGRVTTRQGSQWMVSQAACTVQQLWAIDTRSRAGWFHNVA